MRLIDAIKSTKLYGAFRSTKAHKVLQRKREELRENRCKKRRSLYQQGASKTDLILEVGPLHNPLFPKRDGWNVEIIDRLDQEGLRERYKNDGIDLDAIEYVDYIWDGQSYAQSVKKTGVFDYVVAAHVIEHTTNFVGFLNDCSKLLKENGRLRLVVPDKRYTFDHFRVVTSLSEILNNYYYPQAYNSPGIVGEYAVSVVGYKRQLSWKRSLFPFMNRRMDRNLRDFTFFHTEENALEWMEQVRQTGVYKDVHHYVFTPASFEFLVYELRLMGLIDLEIENVCNKYGNEFMVTLRKSSAPAIRDDMKKMQLLRRRSKESRIIWY